MTWLGRVFHTGCERTTTIGSAAYGLFLGAVAGGLLTAASLALPGVIAGQYYVLAVSVLVAMVASVVWAVGLLLASAGWFVLHVLGARCQQAAMIYGGGIMLIIVAAYLHGSGDGFRDWRTLLSAGLMVLAGVIVGWLVARAAYRPVVKS